MGVEPFTLRFPATRGAEAKSSAPFGSGPIEKTGNARARMR